MFVRHSRQTERHDDKKAGVSGFGVTRQYAWKLNLERRVMNPFLGNKIRPYEQRTIKATSMIWLLTTVLRVSMYHSSDPKYKNTYFTFPSKYCVTKVEKVFFSNCAGQGKYRLSRFSNNGVTLEASTNGIAPDSNGCGNRLTKTMVTTITLPVDELVLNQTHATCTTKIITRCLTESWCSVKMNKCTNTFETQSAVENIPGQDTGSAELRALEDFIQSQGNMAQIVQVDVRYEYDPVNDTLKRIDNTKVQQGKQAGVGEGKLANATSTGKTLNDRLGMSPTSSIINTLFLTYEGTEPLPEPPTADAVPNRATGTTKENASHDITTAPNISTHAVVTPPNSPPDSDDISSCCFSSEETNNDAEKDDSQPTTQNVQGERPLYERIDARIKAQKAEKWKPKKGMQAQDPRDSALIPIHAPGMERVMARANLQALKKRAENRPKDGDNLMSRIMHEMDNLAEINYSIATAGANFVTESEVVPSTNKVVIQASNDPNSIRPKPPKSKNSRNDRVIPFPKRRKQAIQREKEARKGTSRLSDSDSDIHSDESWPTDKDEAIVTLSTRKKRKPTTKPVTKKPKTVKSKPRTKTNATKAPKVTRNVINSLLGKLVEPLPLLNPDPGNFLDAKEVSKLAKAQQARQRQKAFRDRRNLKKQTEKLLSQNAVQLPPKVPTPASISLPTQSSSDVLAQAVSFANILNGDHMIIDDGEVEKTAKEDITNDLTTSSSDSSTSCTSTSSSSEDDHHDITDTVWGKNKRQIRNPFAAKPQQPIRVAPTHLGYFTEQGLEKQAKHDQQLRKEAGLDLNSVVKVKLNRSDVENYLRGLETKSSSNTDNSNNNVNQDSIEAVMSAKNISKDRSASRGRSEKPDRFNKGREGNANPQDEAGKGPEAESAQNPGQGQQQNNDGNTKGNNKRQREPPRTGNHDNTTTEDSDEDMPDAKRNVMNLREKLTQVYQKKTKETREKRDGSGITPSVAFIVDSSHAGEKVKSAAVPLLAPTTLADAPTLSLKDLVPEQARHDLECKGQEESFKTDRIEFVVVERELAEGEDETIIRSDRDYEWEIPDRAMFDKIIGKAIEAYTEDDWDRIDYVSFSSVGWNTGVGLFAFGSDKLEQMNIFREAIRAVRIDNKRFESYPKRMLLNRYALTIYFNSAFAWSPVPKLLFFFKKLNGFEGQLTMAETRFYPDDHPTRSGCKIVACEADQQFLDELYKFPKDHAFNIRYGGNLYVRGGERIDPDDPNAVRPRRPKLTRTAAKRFLHGAGEDILNAGQQADDEAARKAKEAHQKKYVSNAVFSYSLAKIFSYVTGLIFYYMTVGVGKHCITEPLKIRPNKRRINQLAIKIFKRQEYNERLEHLANMQASSYKRRFCRTGGLSLKMNNNNEYITRYKPLMSLICLIYMCYTIYQNFDVNYKSQWLSLFCCNVCRKAGATALGTHMRNCNIGQYNMVNSQCDVSLVITTIMSIRYSLTKVINLLEMHRCTMSKVKKFIRISKISKLSVATSSSTSLLNDYFKANYTNVVISTRAVSAVIMVIIFTINTLSRKVLLSIRCTRWCHSRSRRMQRLKDGTTLIKILNDMEAKGKVRTKISITDITDLNYCFYEYFNERCLRRKQANLTLLKLYNANVTFGDDDLNKYTNKVMDTCFQQSSLKQALVYEWGKVRLLSGKLHSCPKIESGRSLKKSSVYMYRLSLHKMPKLCRPALKVNGCEKGKQVCGKYISYLTPERGRSLRIPAVCMCELARRIKCKLNRRTVTIEEAVGLWNCNVTQDKHYNMLSLSCCDGKT